MATMATRVLTERSDDLRGFSRIKAAGKALPFGRATLEHIYIKLDLKPQFENATMADDARRFLRSVTRAALAAERIAQEYNGFVLEVQGSMLHVGLHQQENVWETVPQGSAVAYAADLHWAFRVIFDDAKLPVDGWRMAVDAGDTMVVTGRGVHGDDSYVSLGSSANRPAKHMYRQLERSEDRRELTRFHVGRWDRQRKQWQYLDLEKTKVHKEMARSIAAEVRRAALTLDYASVRSGLQQIQADAAPIAPARTPLSPSADRPDTYYGWVLRTDLDGFSKRVDECFGDETKFAGLAIEFYTLMNAAADFVNEHKETLAQLPWAGDNFTAAAVFSDKGAYDAAAPRRLVELSLDFENAMGEAATDSGFGGWAQGIAGGEVRWNSGGNVYIAGVHINARRFLVGVGEGFGRSAQAFSDIEPKPRDIVIYVEDWKKLDDDYKAQFKPAVTHSGEESSLYRTAKAEHLGRIRENKATRTKTVSFAAPRGEQREIRVRPHFR